MASGGNESNFAGTLAATATFAGEIDKRDANGAIPPEHAGRIDVNVSYQKIHVLGSNNITVTAG
jgi:hypothetical protein